MEVGSAACAPKDWAVIAEMEAGVGSGAPAKSAKSAKSVRRILHYLDMIERTNIVAGSGW